VKFLRADGAQTGFPLDWRQAALAALEPRGVNISRLALFQDEVAKLLILRPNPRGMEPESKVESKHPDLSMINLTSWYRSLAEQSGPTRCGMPFEPSGRISARSSWWMRD
jgi:hypothetical protein